VGDAPGKVLRRREGLLERGQERVLPGALHRAVVETVEEVVGVAAAFTERRRARGGEAAHLGQVDVDARWGVGDRGLEGRDKRATGGVVEGAAHGEHDCAVDVGPVHLAGGGPSWVGPSGRVG